MIARHSHRERGAAAVEAALVTPLLVLLVFGIIEFSFLVRDYSVVSSNVRVGVRVAATGAAAGPGICETGPSAPPCTSTSSPSLAQEAADAIQRAGSAMDEDAIDYILVYEANEEGYPGSEGNTTMPTSCAGVSECVRFVWRDSLDAFRYAEGSWNHSQISACFPGTSSTPLDSVGVYLKATHPMVTGLFGASIDLGDHAVMDFEPLPTQTCEAGTHG